MNSALEMRSRKQYKKLNQNFLMVSIPNYLEKLEDKIMVLGVSRILKESHLNSGLTCRQVGNLLSLSRDYYQKHLTIKSHCSIKFLKSFSKNIDPTIFDKIYASENIAFTARNKKVFLPKRVDSKLAYFVGYLQGDGCLTSDKKQICFSDEYIEQINKINSLSEKLFGVSGHLHKKKSDLSNKRIPNLEIKSIVVNSFLHTVFGINRGVKKNLKIPQLIKKNKRLLKHYLRGLFDADGTLPRDPQSAKQLFIDITMKDKSIIKEIKDSLLLFNIETLKIYKRVAKSPSSDFVSKTYELRIRKKEMLLKFL